MQSLYLKKVFFLLSNDNNNNKCEANISIYSLKNALRIRKKQTGHLGDLDCNNLLI